MNPITFFAPGIPKGQPRVKACIRGKHAGVYDPGTAESWKECVMWAAKPYRPNLPLSGPLELKVELYFPRPLKYKTKKWIDVDLYCVTKPDFDNAGKPIADALTSLCFWTDDAIVADGRVIKKYTNARHPHPGAQITIQEAK